MDIPAETAKEPGVRIGVILLGIALMVVGLAMYLLPVRLTDFKDLICGTILGTGVTLLTTQIYTCSDRRETAKQHQELKAFLRENAKLTIASNSTNISPYRRAFELGITILPALAGDSESVKRCRSLCQQLKVLEEFDRQIGSGFTHDINVAVNKAIHLGACPSNGFGLGKHCE